MHRESAMRGRIALPVKDARQQKSRTQRRCGRDAYAPVEEVTSSSTHNPRSAIYDLSLGPFATLAALAVNLSLKK
jgi:hypothetical protein